MATITHAGVVVVCDILSESDVVAEPRTIVHQRIDGGTDRTERDPGPRAGTLVVRVTAYADALTLAGVLAAAGVKQLADDDLPYWTFAFVVPAGQRPRVERRGEPTSPWWAVSAEVVEQ